MAHMQEPRASLGKEGVPQGQDLPGGKRCEVEVLHELIGACEHGQVCTVDAILLEACPFGRNAISTKSHSVSLSSSFRNLSVKRAASNRVPDPNVDIYADHVPWFR